MIFRFFKILLLLVGCFWSFESLSKSYWFDSIQNFQRGLKIPYSENIESIQPKAEMLLERSKNIFNRKDNEVPSFYVSNDLKDLEALSKTLAKRGREAVLFEKLKKHMHLGEAKKNRIFLSEAALADINMDVLIRKFFTKSHHKIKIDAEELDKDETLKDELLSQVRPFLNFKDVVDIQRKIEEKTFLELDKDLLPPFPRKLVKTYTHFKGPNCFHAALAFQDPLLPKNSVFHPLRHGDYHWQMINHDELWRMLQGAFYEVDAQNTPLKFGDIVVFFDKPKSPIEKRLC